ncbi:hypothetical protein HDU78_003838 [Chytriomyces hyalinus]|nr:hypothetical protein HDU78_003838 [Chytriomyces hyalinus]KAJ3257050.1 hypothetical protein HDU77_002887 [Chytriomyces hyalinus]
MHCTALVSAFLALFATMALAVGPGELGYVAIDDMLDTQGNVIGKVTLYRDFDWYGYDQGVEPFYFVLNQDCYRAAFDNNQRFFTMVEGNAGQRRCYVKGPRPANGVTLVFPRGEAMIPNYDFNDWGNQFNVYDQNTGAQISKRVGDWVACERYCQENANTFCAAAAFFNGVCYPKIPTYSPSRQITPNLPPVTFYVGVINHQKGW